jgi:hypothetical protein
LNHSVILSLSKDQFSLPLLRADGTDPSTSLRMTSLVFMSFAKVSTRCPGALETISSAQEAAEDSRA